MTSAPPRVVFPDGIELTPCDQNRYRPTPEEITSVGAWLLAELSALRAAEHISDRAAREHGPNSPVAQTRRRAADARREGYAFWLQRHARYRTGAYAITL